MLLLDTNKSVITQRQPSYSHLPNRTQVDQEVDKLAKARTLRRVILSSSDEESKGLVTENDYCSLVTAFSCLVPSSADFRRTG